MLESQQKSFEMSRGKLGQFGCLSPNTRGLEVNVALRLRPICAGRDQPFVNNYGVWTDEYSALGLQHTLDANWEDALCYFGQGKEVRVGRRCAIIENQDFCNVDK